MIRRPFRLRFAHIQVWTFGAEDTGFHDNAVIMYGAGTVPVTVTFDLSSSFSPRNVNGEHLHLQAENAKRPHLQQMNGNCFAAASLNKQEICSLNGSTRIVQNLIDFVSEETRRGPGKRPCDVMSGFGRLLTTRHPAQNVV